MSHKVYWTELIGFDVNSPDLGVSDFIAKTSGDIDSVALLIYNIDFVNEHCGLSEEIALSRGACSYYGHPYNNDRAIQSWTNLKLKALVKELHKHNISVLFSIFDMYAYLDENGSVTQGPFTDSCPEIRMFSSVDYCEVPAICPLKHFADGTSYSEFFIDKLAKVLTDYEFDGYHLADGLSSPRFCIQSGDFSDDIIAQFVAAKNIKLPENISGSCDKSKRRHMARYRYIMSNLRYEFICFMADWYADFYKKLGEKLSGIEKTVIFNNAWTLDPFEALFRYGVDYKKCITKGIDGMMLEDTGAYFSLLTREAISNVPLSPEDRKLANYTVFLTQLSVASYLPDLPQYNMTTLKDTIEDWNLIDAAPFEVHKMIVRRKNTLRFDGNGLKNVSNGVFYCLSDDVPKSQWDRIFAWEKSANTPAPTAPMGFSALWNSDTLYDELSDFIDNRNPSSKHLAEHMLKAGLPIVSMVSSTDIDNFKNPLFATNIEHYSPKLLKKLENFTSAPMVIISKNNPLARKADYTIYEGKNALSAYFYNCPSLCGDSLNLNISTKRVGTGFSDMKGGIWTGPLRYNKPSKKFISEIVKTCDSLSIYPQILKNHEGFIMSYYTSDKSAVLFVNNESYGAENFRIKFPQKIKSVRSLSKPFWYKLHFDGDMFTIRIDNREVDIVEITW